MKIQISTEVPLHQTPVFIPIAHQKMPQGALQLRPIDGSAPIPVQNDDYSLCALLTTPAGTSEFELEEAPSHKSGVTLRKGHDELEIFLPGGSFGTYHFEKSAPRPYIWPLYGPDGVEMTRAFPMENRAGEKHDHPHHRSLWTAFDEVNGVNNWHEGEGHGWTKHQRFINQYSGPRFGGFTVECLWTNAIGESFLREVRNIRVYNVDGATRLFDYDFYWNSTGDDVTFGDTKEAGVLAFRVATSMDGERGGVITNSEGGRGEKECWGKRADWCDYSGEINGETYGITVFSRPTNTAGAPRWHVRDYGLFATNPFSVAAFEGGEKQPFVLEKQQSISFSYRVLLHKGAADVAPLAQIWSALKNPPLVTIV